MLSYCKLKMAKSKPCMWTGLFLAWSCLLPNIFHSGKCSPTKVRYMCTYNSCNTCSPDSSSSSSVLYLASAYSCEVWVHSWKYIVSFPYYEKLFTCEGGLPKLKWVEREGRQGQIAAIKSREVLLWAVCVCKWGEGTTEQYWNKCGSLPRAESFKIKQVM